MRKLLQAVVEWLCVLRMAFLGCCVLLWMPAQSAEFKLGKHSGDVMVAASKEGEWREPRKGEVLTTGWQIKTGEKGKAVLQVTNGTVVVLRPATVVEIRPVVKDGEQIDLEDESVLFEKKGTNNF